MLTLSLLRHAKSSWKNPTLLDRERPLATRGTADAPLVGRAMAERGIDPELVLCSSARRAADTLALVLPELKVEPKVVYEDALYHPSPAEMLDILRAIPPGAGRVMMVGHNPEIQAFALDLVVSAGLWSSVEVNSGSLSVFLAPKELRAS
jgi:phosphohistidine phosphatase